MIRKMSKTLFGVTKVDLAKIQMLMMVVFIIIIILKKKAIAEDKEDPEHFLVGLAMWPFRVASNDSYLTQVNMF